jgi:hypothetical protein
MSHSHATRRRDQAVTRAMRLSRTRLAEAKADNDDLVDADVPAAVVCARCGEADCPGCQFEQTLSGVVAIVPWERLGAPLLQRLWATARATTRDPERFFESLPDGPLGPALRFAVLSEMIAVTAMALLGLVPLAFLAPGWLKHIVGAAGTPALRLAVAGLPMLAALLVAAHAVHGWALDRGARRSGVRGATNRALRFGLYAAGWDLVIGPLGALVVAVREGPGVALSLGVMSVGLPTRSARAFLRGCYGLNGEAARPAMRAGHAAAIAVTLFGAALVIVAMAWALLL